MRAKAEVSANRSAECDVARPLQACRVGASNVVGWESCPPGVREGLIVLRVIFAAAIALAAVCTGAQAQDIKIAHVYDKTGPLEAYAKQSHIGFMMGLEYATGGKLEVLGRKVVVIEKDT